MNTQKGFLSLLGLVLVLAIMGGGAYFYTQSDLSLLKFNKVDESDPNATSTNGISDILNRTQSLVDKKNEGQCVENSDCRDSEICYFKPGGNVGACIAKMSEGKSPVQTSELSLEDIKNATYDLGNGTVALVNGTYNRQMTMANFSISSFGDINNDDVVDALVILEVSGGDSPVSMPFAVFNQNGTIKTVRLYPELIGTNPYFNISKVNINSDGVVSLTYHPDRVSGVEQTVNFKFNGTNLIKE